MAEAVAACVEQYLEWMEAKGYACSTVRTRRTHLQAFARWLDGRGFESLASVGRADIESYRVELFNYRRRAGLALGWGSLTQPLLAVRGFCRWLTLTERLPFNPAADMELPKRGRRVPRRVLSAREMKRVLGVPDVKSDLGLRNRVILEVLYSTGIRRAECARLHTSDLDFERGVVLIRDGKGTRDRFVPIGRRATLWVRQYLRRTSRNLEGSHAGPLFLTQTGTPISVKRLGTIVHEIMLQAGIVGGGSCHLVRHSTATLMLEGGADIRDLQEFLGHAQLSTTAIYARVSIARLQNVHRRTHPAW